MASKTSLPRYLLTFCFIFYLVPGIGQKFSFPEIKATGNSIAHFLPDNWTLLDSASGDLNKDRVPDLVLVFQYRDSVSFEKVEKEYTDTVITRPRMLVIFFYDIKVKQYRLVEQSNSFILNHDQANMEDPFQDISISGGVLKIDFHIFMNAGGWGMVSNAYKFRYQGNGFKLIGTHYHYVHRGSGEMETRSYKFLTGKAKVSTGTIESNKVKSKWKSVRISELKTFKTFDKPFTWEIEKDFFL